ncbi:MAG: LacI family DNA-binding transcriptional regulator [Spirochaetota bacterium]
MAVTMKEIAQKLNISIATVSRALSGKDESVSPETRQAIHAIVNQYGFRKRRTIGKSVAFVIDKDLFNLSSQFYAGIISGVEEELIKNRYYFHFNSIESEFFDLNMLNLNFNDLAGVIIAGVYHNEFVLKLRDLMIPMVLVDYFIPTEEIPSVIIDNPNGIMKACRHLAELGHKRVAYISGDKIEISAQERLFGFERSREMFGFEGDDSYIIGCRGRIDGAFHAMTTLLDKDPPPTAVVAYNDLIALGAMDAIKQRGLSVPQDISVIGFDDIVLASEMIPPLTTIHVPTPLMGVIAVKKLFQIMRGIDDQVHKIVVPTTLIIRASAAPPKF